jgi:hypothetical protein
MRPYKRAKMIARSIVKMIEDRGGASADIARATVFLPAPVFDDLLRDQPAGAANATERLKIQGIVFQRKAERRTAGKARGA